VAIAFLFGRILVAFFYIASGFNHFKNVNMMTGYASSKKVPAAKAGVLGSGTILILGGLSMLLGIYPTIGVILLALFLLPTSFLIHNFWAVGDPMQKMNDRINFMKNIALLGSALMFLAIPQPWAYSVHM
jgi:uncharacterized membrane protein YphA (DoxX/SURF4 family)